MKENMCVCDDDSKCQNNLKTKNKIKIFYKQDHIYNYKVLLSNS